MAEKINVTVVLPLTPVMLDSIRGVSERLNVVYLSSTQRLVYREGRPLWPGYNDPPASDGETEEQAKPIVEEVLAGTEVLLSNPVVPDSIVTRAPNLKWLQLTSAGVDRLLESELVRSGRTAVTTATGIHAVPIGEYVLGAMLASAKGFSRSFRQQANSHWQAYVATELEGATVGILGLGAIGGHVARLSRAFGMRVLATRRSQKERMTGDDAGEPFVDEMLPPAEMRALLAESDYVVVSVPLTAESRHLIGGSELAAMKPNAVIINIARGPVIDQAALVEALKAHKIAGAVLDVTDPEPLPSDNELWGVENATITPHISGGTPKYMDRAIDLFCDNLRRYLDGEPLRNVVDAARGY